MAPTIHVVGTVHVFQPKVPGVVNRLQIMVTPLLNHATKKNIPKKSVGRNRTTLIGMAGSNVPHRVTIGIGLIQAQQLQPVDLLVNSSQKLLLMMMIVIVIMPLHHI